MSFDSAFAGEPQSCLDHFRMMASVTKIRTTEYMNLHSLFSQHSQGMVKHLHNNVVTRIEIEPSQSSPHISSL